MRSITLSIGILIVVSNVQASLISGVGYAPSWPNWIGPSTIDFDSGPTGLFSTNTWGNVTFNGLDYPYNISPNYIGQYNTAGVNSLQSGQVVNPILPSKIEMVFTIPVVAVAFNWGAADNAWALSAFDTGNNLIESHIISYPNSNTNNGEYFGIWNSNIKRILLVDQKDNYPLGDHVFIDDVTTSFESSPEPSSAMLMGIAVPILAGRRRRR